MKFGTKVTLVMLVLTTLTVSSVGGINYWLSRAALHDAVITNLSNVAELEAKHIEDVFAVLRADVHIVRKYYNILVNLPLLVRHAEDREHPSYVQAKLMLDAQLQVWTDVRGEVSNLALVGPDGRIAYSLDRHSPIWTLGNTLPDPSGRGFGEGQRRLYVTEVFPSPRADVDYALLITAPLHDFDGRFVGVLALEIDTASIFELVLDHTGLGTTGETLVGVREDDHALFLNPLRHDPDTALRRAEFGSPTASPIQAAVRGHRGAGLARDYRDEQVVAAWVPLPSLGWGIVAKIDEREAFAPLDDAAWMMLLASLVGSCVTLAFTLLVSRPLEHAAGTQAAHLWTARSQAALHDAIARKRGVEQLAATAARSLQELLDARLAALWVDTGEGFRCLAQIDPQRLLDAHSPSPELLTHVAASRSPLCSIDADLHTVLIPAAHEQVIRGVLLLGSGRAFAERELELLVSIAPTLALSISEAIARDRVEQLLARANASAEQLARASRYKSEFLAKMSHELRTPLNGLLLAARLLEEDSSQTLAPKQEQYVRMILGSGGELLELLDELLDLSKIEAGRLLVNLADDSPAALQSYLRESFEPLAARYGLGFEVVLDPAAPALLRTDPRRVRQVLKNLVVNALKFTDLGHILVWIGPAPPRASDGAAMLAISVRDTGPGIPADKHVLVFEAFEQLDGNSQGFGSGLGLAISREFARLLGGELELESVAGLGSTFTLILPVDSRSPA